MSLVVPHSYYDPKASSKAIINKLSKKHFIPNKRWDMT